MFTIGESRLIFQANERERQAQELSIQQLAGNPRRGSFTIETPQQRELRLEIRRASNEEENERVHRSPVEPESE